jgi:hypothetical protein
MTRQQIAAGLEALVVRLNKRAGDAAGGVHVVRVGVCEGVGQRGADAAP